MGDFILVFYVALQQHIKSPYQYDSHPILTLQVKDLKWQPWKVKILRFMKILLTG